MHLVIATREDPQLPLARFRARGQLTELRAADLRFTPAEAADFLNQVMGLNLSAEDIAALETRTEGWIAGLQLAAISMRGHASQDTTSFIKSFTGSHHFVLDYLVEEVLQQQTESVQTFLLRTSILDRLCGPLCDARAASAGASANQQSRITEYATRWLAIHPSQPSLSISNTPTCSLSPWTTSGAGTAITISLLNCCGSGCTKAQLQGMKREAWPNTTFVPAYGMKTMAWRLEAFHHAAIANDIERAERLITGGGIPLHSLPRGDGHTRLAGCAAEDRIGCQTLVVGRVCHVDAAGRTDNWCRRETTSG